MSAFSPDVLAQLSVSKDGESVCFPLFQQSMSYGSLNVFRGVSHLLCPHAPVFCRCSKDMFGHCLCPPVSSLPVLCASRWLCVLYLWSAFTSFFQICADGSMISGYCSCVGPPPPIQRYQHEVDLCWCSIVPHMTSLHQLFVLLCSSSWCKATRPCSSMNLI